MLKSLNTYITCLIEDGGEGEELGEFSSALLFNEVETVPST